MTKRLVVLNIVGLSRNLIGESTPFINSYVKNKGMKSIDYVAPAVTCSVQSTYLTGTSVREHGIVGNGWYNKELAEIMFWKQSNHLVSGKMVWEEAKEKNPSFTCAQLFWWYNMYNTADWSVTPRPLYPIDGRKIPDIYCSSDDLRFELNNLLGQFPLFNFWGPNSNIVSSKWIKDCAIHIHNTKRPTLNLVYIPHLDYSLQKYGPLSDKIKEELLKVDDLAKQIYEEVKDECHLLIMSEYSISEVNGAIFPNRLLREKGWIKTKKEFDYEMLDAGASQAFAVCDHQIAHIYLNDKSIKQEVYELFKSMQNIAHVLKDEELAGFNLDHPRSGDIVLISNNKKWFSYYFWLEDSKAPDYARTVDIHRKPGYDPVELFIDPQLKFPKFKILYKLLLKKLGFRTVLDVIPLNASLVKGSHGAIPQKGHEPVLIGDGDGEMIKPESIKSTMLKYL